MSNPEIFRAGAAAHNSLSTGHILQFGNEARERKHLPERATGEWINVWGWLYENPIFSNRAISILHWMR
ncbi:MAG: hypothetical protein EPN37_04685 [Chitinophagaceae bacterium]|nr:MAG: hypothetical protein EPN37_04685 [Chitinophagaceae bacterium]